MKNLCTFVTVLFLIVLPMVSCKDLNTPKKACSRASLLKRNEKLYNKTITGFKASFPRDTIMDIKLLTDNVRKDFMESCDMRHQLLSFYLKDVLRNNKVFSKARKFDFIQDFMIIQEMLSHCSKSKCSEHDTELQSMKNLKKKFHELNKDKKLWKAISELEILLRWIHYYLH
ncbi:interleukin-26 [Spea bombifrons]|uniref:interleukin-26 n=1 Tax=Spea bombifrons TaxID=233779 RepID=UPI00234B0617|nr:interleukin-26 [Spea bombifrons]